MNIIISSEELAKVMIHILFNGAPKQLLENKDLRRIIRDVTLH